MIYLYGFTVLVLMVSAILNKKKTIKGLFIAWKRFRNIFPAFLLMFIFISVIVYYISDAVILKYLGGTDKLSGTVIAYFIGSITLLPGFIAYPLCGVLLHKGVPYMVLAAFTTTLMMVGVLTYPLEKKYFGVKVTVIRNSISFIIALTVAAAIGFFFGEL